MTSQRNSTARGMPSRKPVTSVKREKPKLKQRMPLVMLPYKQGSQSAKALAEELGKLVGYRIRRLFTDRSNPTFKVKPWHTFINWGLSNYEPGGGKKTINNLAAL